MDFVPATKKEEQMMLKTIGVSSLDDLFTDIRKEHYLKNHY